MNQWHAFLSQQGAVIANDHVASFGETPSDYPAFAGRSLLFPLDDRGILRLSSGQAGQTEKLLQGQLTCDVTRLGEETTIPGALCTPKGRMISNFMLARDSEGDFYMVMHRGLLAATADTLKKFAPFYKTEIDDVSDSMRVLGLCGQFASRAIDGDRGAILSAVSPDRSAAIVPASEAEALWQELVAEARPAGLPYWHLLDIRDGLGEVRPETREEFIPQMLNLQFADAISFKKGCYTGQEIVARMHYLGKLKRRMYRLGAAGQTPPPAGDPCQVPGSSGNAGHVVFAERADDDNLEMLAVLTPQAAASPELTVGDATLAVKVLPLPYEDQFKSGDV
jgi:hypothetical protein